MASIEILNYTNASNLQRQEMEDIFFESSTKKTFISEAERDEFRYKYLGYYLANTPAWCWLAAGAQQEVLGYVVASATTTEEFFTHSPHLAVFADLYEQFPAHLHINCHHNARGLGVGGALIKNTLQQCCSQQLAGVHIITASDARNVSFYHKLGFTYKIQRLYQNRALLLMGFRWT